MIPRPRRRLRLLRRLRPQGRPRRRRGQQGDERPPRRQGRQPGRDGRDRPARPPRLHRLDRGLRPLYYKNRERDPRSVRLEVEKNLKKLEKAVGQGFGDPKNPLLVSVRSGARASMPGMMDTILNLGLNDKTVEAPHRQDRQRALRLRLLPPLRPDVRRRRPRPQAREQGRHRPVRRFSSAKKQEAGRQGRGSPTSPPPTSRNSSPASRRPSRRRLGVDFPGRTPRSSSGARSAPSSAPG